MGWLEAVKDRFARLIEGSREFFAAAAERLGVRRKWVFISLGALALLLVIAFSVPALLTRRSSRSAPHPGSDISEAFKPGLIPPEELFLPEEPDFLPGVIPERERREVWTAEDAEPFWTDPLEAGPKAYLDRIGGTIDEMMERVP
jgi:hypothetical protein